MSTTLAYDAGKTRIYDLKGLDIAPAEGPHGWATAEPSPAKASSSPRKTIPFIPLPPPRITAEAESPPPSQVPTRPPLAVASMLVLSFAGLAASIGMAVEAML